jgi:calmodulin
MSQKRKLSLATREEIFATFQEFDKDGDGTITLDEAQEILHEELGFNTEQTKQLINMCDKNKDGVLSYDEFVEFFFKMKEKMSDLMGTFLEFDKDKDGYISIQEAKEAMHRLGIFDDDEIEALVISYDDNKDGRLQYEEFVKFWNAQ